MGAVTALLYSQKDPSIAGVVSQVNVHVHPVSALHTTSVDSATGIVALPGVFQLLMLALRYLWEQLLHCHAHTNESVRDFTSDIGCMRAGPACDHVVCRQSQRNSILETASGFGSVMLWPCCCGHYGSN